MTRTVLAVLLAGLAGSASADDIAPTPFDRGKIGIGVYGGSQTALGHRYFGIGATVGYYVLDGIQIALGGVEQFGDGPNIAVVTPSLRYVVQPLVGVSPVVPYVGTFYNHWFISGGLADQDTLGGRGGVLYVQGKLILGLGAVYERVISECESGCSAIYPELSIAFAL